MGEGGPAWSVEIPPMGVEIGAYFAPCVDIYAISSHTSGNLYRSSRAPLFVELPKCPRGDGAVVVAHGGLSEKCV